MFLDKKPVGRMEWFGKYVYAIGVIGIMSIFFVIGFAGISKFETADEHFWVKSDNSGRVQRYWNAIETHNWSKTRVNDKPGISLAIISGWPSIFDKTPKEAPDYSIMTTFRVPLLIFIGLFAFYFYWAIKQLFGRRVALLWLALTYLSPVIMGISRIINPDALTWLFSFAAFISWLLFFEKGKRRDLVLGVLFLAAAALSKYSTLMMIPFIFLAWFLYFIAEKENEDKLKAFKSISFFWTGMAMMVAFFCVMMPAAIVNQRYIYTNLVYFDEMLYVYGAMLTISAAAALDIFFFKGVARKMIREVSAWMVDVITRFGILFFFLASVLAFLNWSFGNNFLKVDNIPFDISQGDEFGVLGIGEKILLELKPLVFSLTPSVLLLLAVALLYTFMRGRKASMPVSLSIGFVGIFYAAVLQQGLLVTPRYAIVLYPFLFLFISISLMELLGSLKMDMRKKMLVYAIFILIAAKSVSISKIAPYYFAYANDLLPKYEAISNAWGYGSFEAAQYLNSLPGAEEMRIFSDDSVVCSFFVGNCRSGSGIKASSVSKQGAFDYYVRTRRGSINSNVFWSFTEANDPLILDRLVWTLKVDGRLENSINIYKGPNNNTEEIDQ